MSIYQSSSLSISVDEGTGCIDGIRTRPGGFALPLQEVAPETDPPDSAPQGHPAETVGLVADDLVPAPSGPLGPMPTLQVVSRLAGRGPASISRLLRVPRQALAQRVEVLAFDYQVDPGGLESIPLLRFRGPLDAVDQDGTLAIYAERYFLKGVMDSDGPAGWSLLPVPGSRDHVLSLHPEGALQCRVAFSATSLEEEGRDAVLHLLGAPLDAPTFLLAALFPAVRSIPLSTRPRARLFRPAPTLVYQPRAVRGALPRLMRRLGMGARRVAPPPRDYPVAFLARSTDAVVEVWRRDDVLSIPALALSLAMLPPGRAASTQRMVMLTRGPLEEGPLADVRTVVTSVRLPRVEGWIPPACTFQHERLPDDAAGVAAVLERVDEGLDALVGPEALPPRAEWRREYGADPLPPVPVELDADPVEAAPLLAAARLRESFVLGGAKSLAGVWPRPPADAGGAGRAAAVARCTLADISTHQALLESEEADAWPRVWTEHHRVLERGEARAERVVFAVASGADAATDRMKLLPAILYSAQEPAPLLPLRIPLKGQREVLNRFRAYTALAQEACIAAARGDGRSPGTRFFAALQARRGALQRALGNCIPADYLDFLREARPKEIINFSVLPLEWLELDGVPLGYLSKVATVRSARPESDAAECHDLAAVFNGLGGGDRARAPSPLPVLILAPRYPAVFGGKLQNRVNEATDGFVALLEKQLRAQAARGREIEISTHTGASAAQVRELFSHHWSLVLYIGHADRGALVLPDGRVSPADLPHSHLPGCTAVLVGCDTQAAASMSGSVATQFLALGAKAVFSTYFPISTRLAEDIVVNLFAYMLGENYPYGDVTALCRSSALWQHWVMFMGLDLGRRLQPGVRMMAPDDGDYEAFRDGWGRSFGELRRQLADLTPPPGVDQAAYAGSVLARAALAGLALNLSGNPRARVFDF